MTIWLKTNQQLQWKTENSEKMYSKNTFENQSRNVCPTKLSSNNEGKTCKSLDENKLFLLLTDSK